MICLKTRWYVFVTLDKVIVIKLYLEGDTSAPFIEFFKLSSFLVGFVRYIGLNLG